MHEKFATVGQKKKKKNYSREFERVSFYFLLGLDGDPNSSIFNYDLFVSFHSLGVSTISMCIGYLSAIAHEFNRHRNLFFLFIC